MSGRPVREGRSPIGHAIMIRGRHSTFWDDKAANVFKSCFGREDSSAMRAWRRGNPLDVRIGIANQSIVRMYDLRLAVSPLIPHSICSICAMCSEYGYFTTELPHATSIDSALRNVASSAEDDVTPSVIGAGALTIEVFS